LTKGVFCSIMYSEKIVTKEKYIIMLDVLVDALLDTLKLLPFLFVTYLIMEFLEHKSSEKTTSFIQNSGKLGPLYGSALGIIPQCGFSAAASSLFSGRVITLGTLIAVFLSTSDEMLPIMISEAVNIKTILLVLGLKLAYGIICGFAIDFILRRNHKSENMKISEFCESNHCHCEKGIFYSAVIHTLQIVAWIFAFIFVLNTIIFFVGEDTIKDAALSTPVIANLLSALFGLVPNCAASVIITELYIEGLIPFGAMMSGLFVGAGIGLMVLFKTNKHLKQNIFITVILYATGAVGGIMISIFEKLLS